MTEQCVAEVPSGPSWADVTPDMLYAMLTEGKSYGQIAQAFGVSRSVVGGAVHRYRRDGKFPFDLPRKQKPPAKPKEEPKPQKTVVRRRSRKVNMAALPLPEDEAEETIVRTLDPPTNPPVDALGLTSGMCAYVVQERPYLYCGCRADGNPRLRLCAYHAQGFFYSPVRRSTQP